MKNHITFLIAAIQGEIEPILALFIPLGMLLFGITMTSGCFWWEAKKTKPFLIELLKGIEQLPTRK